jgi:hypothetical protein
MIGLTNGKFADWAVQPSSGGSGDPSANVWFCGIEPGSARTVHQGAVGDFGRLRDAIAGGAQPRRPYNWDENLRHRFGLWQSKLLTAIADRPQGSHRTACRDVPLMKLNLYPVSFPDSRDHRWSEHDFAGTTGIPTKALYRAWCEAVRFPVLARFVAEHRPRLIVGSGLTFVERFIAAFGGATGVSRWREVQLEDGVRYYAIDLAGSSTHLAVIPFYGRPGALNSDDLVLRIGHRIRQEAGLLDAAWLGG